MPDAKDKLSFWWVIFHTIGKRFIDLERSSKWKTSVKWSMWPAWEEWNRRFNTSILTLKFDQNASYRKLFVSAGYCFSMNTAGSSSLKQLPADARGQRGRGGRIVILLCFSLVRKTAVSFLPHLKICQVVYYHDRWPFFVSPFTDSALLFLHHS